MVRRPRVGPQRALGRNHPADRIVRLAPPDDPEVAGLLALMLLNEARRPARTDARGELITLAEQDPKLGNRDLIDAGFGVDR